MVSNKTIEELESEKSRLVAVRDSTLTERRTTKRKEPVKEPSKVTVPHIRQFVCFWFTDTVLTQTYCYIVAAIVLVLICLLFTFFLEEYTDLFLTREVEPTRFLSDDSFASAPSHPSPPYPPASPPSSPPPPFLLQNEWSARLSEMRSRFREELLTFQSNYGQVSTRKMILTDGDPKRVKRFFRLLSKGNRMTVAGVGGGDVSNYTHHLVSWLQEMVPHPEGHRGVVVRGDEGEPPLKGSSFFHFCLRNSLLASTQGEVEELDDVSLWVVAVAGEDLGLAQHQGSSAVHLHLEAMLRTILQGVRSSAAVVLLYLPSTESPLPPAGTAPSAALLLHDPLRDVEQMHELLASRYKIPSVSLRAFFKSHTNPHTSKHIPTDPAGSLVRYLLQKTFLSKEDGTSRAMLNASTSSLVTPGTSETTGKTETLVMKMRREAMEKMDKTINILEGNQEGEDESEGVVGLSGKRKGSSKTKLDSSSSESSPSTQEGEDESEGGMGLRGKKKGSSKTKLDSSSSEPPAASKISPSKTSPSHKNPTSSPHKSLGKSSSSSKASKSSSGPAASKTLGKTRALLATSKIPKSSSTKTPPAFEINDNAFEEAKEVIRRAVEEIGVPVHDFSGGSDLVPAWEEAPARSRGSSKTRSKDISAVRRLEDSSATTSILQDLLPPPLLLPDDAEPICLHLANMGQFRVVLNSGWTVHNHSFTTDVPNAELVLKFKLMERRANLYLSHMKTHVCEPRCPGKMIIRVDQGKQIQVDGWNSHKGHGSVLQALGAFSAGFHSIELKFIGDDDQVVKVGHLLGHKLE